MKTTFDHVQINVRPENMAFYREVVDMMDWNVIFEADFGFGCKGESGPSLWFVGAANGANNDYDGAGVNHLGFTVPSIEAVDKVSEMLKQKNISPLFDTPRHHPEFTRDGQVYYQVMFATPDKLLIEVMYLGQK